MSNPETDHLDQGEHLLITKEDVIQQSITEFELLCNNSQSSLLRNHADCLDEKN